MLNVQRQFLGRRSPLNTHLAPDREHSGAQKTSVRMSSVLESVLATPLRLLHCLSMLVLVLRK